MWPWGRGKCRPVMRLIGVFYASFSSVYPPICGTCCFNGCTTNWVGDWPWHVACSRWHCWPNGTRPQYKLTDKMICLSKNTKNIYTENTNKTNGHLSRHAHATANVQRLQHKCEPHSTCHIQQFANQPKTQQEPTPTPEPVAEPVLQRGKVSLKLKRKQKQKQNRKLHFV